MRLGIEQRFPKAHHFSSEKFASPARGLQHFYNWCLYREIKEENSQTLNRALKVARLVDQGMDFETACANAWRTYPIRTR